MPAAAFCYNDEGLLFPIWAMKILQTFLLFVLLGGTSLWAQLDVGIVLPFENNTRDPNLEWISESFVEVLSSNLVSSRFLMLGRRERAAAFDSLGIPHSSILSIATVYKVAQELDTTKVIVGSYQYGGGVFQATAQVLEMDGPSLGEKFVESGPLTELLALQTGLAWQIQRFLRPTLMVSKGEYIRDRRGPRLDAFENYLRGLLSTDRAQQIQFFRTAQRLDPGFTKAAFQLGMIFFQDRDYPTSVLWLSKLRRGEPDYLEANYFLGLAYLYLEQYERSAAAFRVIAQRLPLNEVYNNLAIALMRQDRPGAVQYFEKAAESDPGDPDYQFNLGYAYWKQGRYSEAVPHLAKALQSSQDPAWRAVYVQCLLQAGQREESSRQAQLLGQEADSGLNRDPKKLEKLERPKDNYDGVSFRQLLMLLQIQSELKHFKLSLQEHVAIHFQRGQDLAKEGFEREAVEEIQQAIDYDPEDARSYQALAEIYLKSGRMDEALKTLNQSLDLEPSAEGHLLLAKIYLGQGRLEDAEAQLNTALRLEPYSREAADLRDEINAKMAPVNEPRR
ncbi:MAG: tetratricopeptide repeat protein [Acidobacteria bacterium]|nr:tetratricopeptide repeat protein [Acidobacteriota bacterium]